MGLSHLAPPPSHPQSHAVGADALLLGGKGSGKTAAARRFAAALGYEPHVVYCYRDMGARDLLLRRETDASGSTVWRRSGAGPEMREALEEMHCAREELRERRAR